MRHENVTRKKDTATDTTPPSDVDSFCAHSLHPTSTNGHTQLPVQQASTKSVNMPSSLKSRWTRDQANSQTMTKEVCSQSKRTSSIQDQDIIADTATHNAPHAHASHTHAPLVHNASALFCALEQQNADRPKKKKKHTVDIRFKNEASKTFFPLLLCVLPSRPADPHSPNKNMHTHTKMRETRSRSSTNMDPQVICRFFHPQRS